MLSRANRTEFRNKKSLRKIYEISLATKNYSSNNNNNFHTALPLETMTRFSLLHLTPSKDVNLHFFLALRFVWKGSLLRKPKLAGSMLNFEANLRSTLWRSDFHFKQTLWIIFKFIVIPMRSLIIFSLLRSFIFSVLPPRVKQRWKCSKRLGVCAILGMCFTINFLYTHLHSYFHLYCVTSRINQVFFE